MLFIISITFTSAAEKKKALVTGGAGFLGSHMCEKLLESGYKVLCLDNFQTGSIDNIAHLGSNPDFSYIKHDVSNPIPEIENLDEIYNFACAASPPQYQKDPIHTMKTCVLGALNILELATKANTKVFQASTSEVYGDPNEHPQKESYWGHVNPHGIRSCYDEGKRSAETIFFDYLRTKKARIKVGRIFNTYGPRMNLNDGRVISNFIVQCLQGSPITIYGSGMQTRSFCYVSDLIDAIYTFMQTPDQIVGPINLGNPDEYTIEDTAHKILKMTRSSSVISFHDLPEDDPQKRRPDISLAYKELKWKPKVSLSEGLQTTIHYFKEELSRQQQQTACNL
ncbi:NAD-dependent dehydratase [Candidatus Aerophobetes bacterium]|uniref:UDP-glucuronate decarboxylase n=1 Tax=Aerophobetes bacterium TaxID=2030807 RepID=A0A2A4YJG4_UNCAE|nr:MAG: NAD-dependent dehydratase [Candidatus Aerophobetes bacterium]